MATASFVATDEGSCAASCSLGTSDSSTSGCYGVVSAAKGKAAAEADPSTANSDMSCRSANRDGADGAVHGAGKSAPAGCFGRAGGRHHPQRWRRQQ